MNTVASVTGRTVLEYQFTDMGELEVCIRRDGMTVYSPSLGREEGFNRNDTVEVSRNGVVTITDMDGEVKSKWKDGEQRDIPASA